MRRFRLAKEQVSEWLWDYDQSKLYWAWVDEHPDEFITYEDWTEEELVPLWESYDEVWVCDNGFTYGIKDGVWDILDTNTGVTSRPYPCGGQTPFDDFARVYGDGTIEEVDPSMDMLFVELLDAVFTIHDVAEEPVEIKVGVTSSPTDERDITVTITLAVGNENSFKVAFPVERQEFGALLRGILGSRASRCARESREVDNEPTIR